MTDLIRVRHKTQQWAFSNVTLKDLAYDLNEFLNDYNNLIIEYWTGMRDCKNQLIYEGDVYRVYWYTSSNEKILSEQHYEVVFFQGAFCGKRLGSQNTNAGPLGWQGNEEEGDSEVYIDDWLVSRLEVVGTIHDKEYKELAKGRDL